MLNNGPELEKYGIEKHEGIISLRNPDTIFVKPEGGRDYDKIRLFCCKLHL